MCVCGMLWDSKKFVGCYEDDLTPGRVIEKVCYVVLASVYVYVCV